MQNLFKPGTMQRLLCLSLLTFLFSSCVSISDGVTCSVAGDLSAGAICSHLLSSVTNDLSFNETLDLLEPQQARTCVPVAGLNVCSDNQAGIAVSLPARGAAIIMSTDDWGALKSELEIACRELGKRCSYKMQQLAQ